MGDAYRFLIIDDNADDRVLTAAELHREFPGCQVTEVGDPHELERILQERCFDAVITDFQLRWTTGLDVLRTVKRRCPDRPVIMFTATGTQEVAVEAMKAGLSDYVIKAPAHFVRLPVAVRSALGRAELERRAVRAEARLRELMEDLEVGVFRSTLLGRILECNTALLRLLGVRSLEEANASSAAVLLRWEAGHPGSLDLLRPPGDRSSRRATLTRPDGTSAQVIVRDVVRALGDEVVVDGIVQILPPRTPQRD